MEITDFLNSICEKESERFRSPFESMGYWCATDAHIAVLIKKDIMPLLGYPEGNTKISVLLNVERPINVPISVKDFAAQLTPEMIDEMDYSNVKDCPECGGEGKVECPECGHEYNCPECKGEGTIGKAIPTGRQIPNPDKLFQLGGVAYKYKYLSQIPILAEIMGVKEVTCRNIGHIHSAVFVIGKAELFIMPFNTIESGLPKIKVPKLAAV
jgi:hypothetical protein